MNQPATKSDIKNLGAALRDEVRENAKGIITHFNASQDAQNQHLESIGEDVAKIKLAVVDLIASDRHLHNLVRELKAQGLKLDETKIFASS